VSGGVVAGRLEADGLEHLMDEARTVEAREVVAFPDIGRPDPSHCITHGEMFKFAGCHWSFFTVINQILACQEFFVEMDRFHSLSAVRWRIFIIRSALASICRILSLVNERICAISSRVLSRLSSSPYLRTKTL